MGERTLVEGLLQDSKDLVLQLDVAQFQPAFAAWYYYDDVGDWRFLLASDKLDALLPRQEHLAYQKVAEALSACQARSLSISWIKVLKTDEDLPRATRMLITTPADDIVQANFSSTTLNGIFIQDIIILRSAMG